MSQVAAANPQEMVAAQRGLIEYVDAQCDELHDELRDAEANLALAQEKGLASEGFARLRNPEACEVRGVHGRVAPRPAHALSGTRGAAGVQSARPEGASLP